MQHDLKVQLINNNKFMISVNDYNKFFVDKIYFIGKMGSDCDNYREAILSYIKNVDDRVNILTISDLESLEPSNDFIVLYVDTKFSERFDNLLTKKFVPAIINNIVERENEQFKNIIETLKKFQHLIIQ